MGWIGLGRILEQEASKVGLQINSTNVGLWLVVTRKASLDIHASGATIETVEDFCYMGSYISSTGYCDKEVRVQVSKASAIFFKAIQSMEEQENQFIGENKAV